MKLVQTQVIAYFVALLSTILQVFVALRLWDRRLTAEQMQTMCRGLATCLPASPTYLDALEWREVAEELALVEPYYAGSYQVRLMCKSIQPFQTVWALWDEVLALVM